MNATEVAVILTAIGTFASTVILALRGLRSDKTTAAEKANASLVGGYTSLIEELRDELGRLRATIEAERSAWALERAQLLAEIDDLRVVVRGMQR